MNTPRAALFATGERAVECAGQHDLFDSGHTEDHLRARQRCARCDIAWPCLREAIDQAHHAVGQVPHGTWGGVLWHDGQPVDLGVPA